MEEHPVYHVLVPFFFFSHIANELRCFFHKLFEIQLSKSLIEFSSSGK